MVDGLQEVVYIIRVYQADSNVVLSSTGHVVLNGIRCINYHR